MNREELRQFEKRIEEKYKNKALEASIQNIREIKRLRSRHLMGFRYGKKQETISKSYNKLIHIDTFLKVRRYFIENVRKKEVCKV